MSFFHGYDGVGITTINKDNSFITISMPVTTKNWQIQKMLKHQQEHNGSISILHSRWRTVGDKTMEEENITLKIRMTVKRYIRLSKIKFGPPVNNPTLVRFVHCFQGFRKLGLDMCCLLLQEYMGCTSMGSKEQLRRISS